VASSFYIDHKIASSFCIMHKLILLPPDCKVVEREFPQGFEREREEFPQGLHVYQSLVLGGGGSFSVKHPNSSNSSSILMLMLPFRMNKH
jgi:hypothetical protein